MAALSRGLSSTALPGSRSQISYCRRQLFSQCSVLKYATTKPLRLSKPKAHSKATTAQVQGKHRQPTAQKQPLNRSSKAVKQTPKFRSFAESLGAKEDPTQLYQAPEHGGYVAASYTAGIFCFSWAGYHVWQHYLFPPADLPFWVPPLYGVIGFAMTCFGTWIILGPSRLIRTMTAIPKPTGLHIRLEVRRSLPIPFRGPKVLEVPVGDVTLASRMQEPASQLAKAKQEEADEWKRQRELDKTRILSAPFRDFSHFAWRGFRAMSRVWIREGFMRVYLKNHTGAWKMDVQGGWSLDEGRGIDRLVKIKSTGL